jgi:hypothetical protein
VARDHMVSEMLERGSGVDPGLQVTTRYSHLISIVHILDCFFNVFTCLPLAPAQSVVFAIPLGHHGAQTRATNHHEAITSFPTVATCKVCMPGRS